MSAVDLGRYERVKFGLAEAIRSAELAVREREGDPSARSQAERSWRDLLTRLAEDRFTVVVAGRFNRGKSSLMNAILGTDRLPTGVVPLTSVITCVRYGTSERVVLEYQGPRLAAEARVEELAEYVTERGNPGNAKGLRLAEIQLPAEILRRGFLFVDTPGLGSAIFENTRTTENFLSEIDVLILVTSYDSPLTADEVRFLERAAAAESVRAIYVVVNKHDMLPPGSRAEVLEYVTGAAAAVLGERLSRPFSVSARDGLAAKRANDARALAASGIAEFEQELVRFLAANRAELFLSAMCARVLAQLDALPGPDAEAIAARVRALREEIRRVETAAPGSRPPAEVAPRLSPRQGAPCEICREVLGRVTDFLGRYQYELSARPDVQERHAREGGFCPQHTWQYERITSPRAVATSCPRLLERVADGLRALASDPEKGARRGGLLDHPCPACAVREAAEDRLARSASAEMVLCLPHLERALARMEDAPAREKLLLRHAQLFERVAEDMQRYAIKHDGLRRHLASKEESAAPLLGLHLLAGDRDLSGIAASGDGL